MQESPAPKGLKALLDPKACQEIQEDHPGLLARKATMDPKARLAFKGLREMMVRLALKASPDHPEPMERLDPPDPKAHKVCRVIPAARRVRKAPKEMMALPVLKARPVR